VDCHDDTINTVQVLLLLLLSLLDQGWRSYVIIRFVCHSVCEHERVNGRRPNMVGKGKSLEVIKFSCWSRSWCGFQITFPFPWPLRN